jgi:hypothetical protein
MSIASIKEWIARKIAEREIEKAIRSLEKGRVSGMKIGNGLQIIFAGALSAAAIAGLDATLEYIKVNALGEFVWAELGRSALIAALGGILLWLRAPKDKPPQVPPGQ